MSDESSIETRSTRALLVVNARVRTNDPRRPWADAVLIDDSRIDAVGTSAELRKRGTRDVMVLDARGLTLLPASAGDMIARGQPANLVLVERSAEDSGETPLDDGIVLRLAAGRVVLDRDSMAG
jgi:hypothetical protein